jgi:hypothetical protein
MPNASFEKKEQKPFRSCGGTRRRKKEITKLDKRTNAFSREALKSPAGKQKTVYYAHTCT